MVDYTSIDKNIDNLVKPISDLITEIIFFEINFINYSLPLIVLWLVLASLYFTFYFNFINLKALKRGFNVAMGKYD